MMLGELRVVLDKVAADAAPAVYRDAILEDNILGKPTRTTRMRTAQRLAELYVFDLKNLPFCVLRAMWSAEIRSQPMLAFLLACWRDPLLRQLTPSVISIPHGRVKSPQETVEELKHEFPHRFGDRTLLSTAQNLSSSWTQAGYLAGKIRKIRARPAVTPVVTAFALLLGYLRGGRGELLLESVWVKLLDCSRNEIAELAAEASKQGWMQFKSAGSVTEITFPTWIASTDGSIS